MSYLSTSLFSEPAVLREFPSVVGIQLFLLPFLLPLVVTCGCGAPPFASGCRKRMPHKIEYTSFRSLLIAFAHLFTRLYP